MMGASISTVTAGSSKNELASSLLTQLKGNQKGFLILEELPGFKSKKSEIYVAARLLELQGLAGLISFNRSAHRGASRTYHTVDDRYGSLARKKILYDFALREEVAKFIAATLGLSQDTAAHRKMLLTYSLKKVIKDEKLLGMIKMYYSYGMLSEITSEIELEGKTREVTITDKRSIRLLRAENNNGT